MQFSAFPSNFHLPQVERSLISSMIDLYRSYPQDLPNDLRLDLRKLGIEKKILKLEGHTS